MGYYEVTIRVSEGAYEGFTRVASRGLCKLYEVIPGVI